MQASVLDTITTVDQNTGRQITWEIESARECVPTERYPWTHTLVLRRPAGKRLYVMDATLLGDVVVEHSAPRVWF